MLASLMRLPGSLLFASLAIASGAAFLACEGCKNPTSPITDGAAPRGAVGPATLRLYIASDIAGALEPCGCVKDQLGGIDHLGALVARDASKANASAFVAAGPLFFLDTELKPERKAQEVAKAETLAAAMKSLGLVAFSPGDNDFAAGDDKLATLTRTSGASLLFANAKSAVASSVPFAIRDVGGVKVGVVGVASPKSHPAGAPYEAVAQAVIALKAQGAQILIALVAAGRGEAKRLADRVPELQAIVVGSSGGAGEANTDTPVGERINNVVIVETGNHLQTVVALDFWIRDKSPIFADASSLDEGRKRRDLLTRINELRGKIADRTRDGQQAREEAKEDVAELAAKRAEVLALDEALPPKTGNFLRYRIHEIGDALGKEGAVTGLLTSYYKRVNDENKLAFADKKPRPLGKDESGYAGVEACSSCHEGARKVWDSTAHAHAYKTLSDQFKEYNLDCVSCHVTGYDAPGGSTVTAVAKLKDVQCEVCHGPGAQHANAPAKVKIPIAKPQPDACLTCHHAPHVHSFAAAEKLQSILGPGHGRPAN